MEKIEPIYICIVLSFGPMKEEKKSCFYLAHSESEGMKYVFIGDVINMYSNLVTNSNRRHNADPNKANNGTDNGRAKRHIFTKKGKLFKYLLYVERRF